MDVYGLTGGIGSGKSAVADLLEGYGIPVVSADELSRIVVARGSEGLRQVVEAFGPEVLTDAKELNRRRLASLVFESSERRKDLEAILHPRIRERFEQVLDALEKGGHQVAVYEVPLLFEKNLQNDMKAVILVTADEALRIRRVQARDDVTEAEVRARMAAQMDEDQKRRRADYVIENNGSRDDLRREVEFMLERFMRIPGLRRARAEAPSKPLLLSTPPAGVTAIFAPIPLRTATQQAASEADATPHPSSPLRTEPPPSSGKRRRPPPPEESRPSQTRTEPPVEPAAPTVIHDDSSRPEPREPEAPHAPSRSGGARGSAKTTTAPHASVDVSRGGKPSSRTGKTVPPPPPPPAPKATQERSEGTLPPARPPAARKRPSTEPPPESGNEEPERRASLVGPPTAPPLTPPPPRAPAPQGAHTERSGGQAPTHRGESEATHASPSEAAHAPSEGETGDDSSSQT